MSVTRNSGDQRLVVEFVNDSLELLGEFELGLRKLQSGPTQPALVDHLFRLVHSIKGNAGFFGGFQAVRRVAHSLEDVLDGFRRAGRVSSALEHALLAEGSTLLAQALRAYLEAGAGERDRPTTAQIAEHDAYCDKVREQRTRIADEPAAPAGGPEGAGMAGAAGPAEAGGALARSSTVKVESAGLAVLSREMFAIREGFAELLATSPGAQLLHDRLVAAAHLLADLRTMPLDRLFDRLPGMVSTLAKSLGKSVAVETEGGDLRIDRGLVETLEVALVHLLRNALDHGIERQDLRSRRGKPAVGVLAVRARLADNRLVLRVEDDGAGIDPKRMRMEAVVRKLLTEPEAAQLSDGDAIALVFRPGFSTAATTSEVSGRGVGMDAVLSSVRGLGGEVQIQSVPRQGTAIIIDLPAVPAGS